MFLLLVLQTIKARHLSPFLFIWFPGELLPSSLASFSQSLIRWLLHPPNSLSVYTSRSSFCRYIFFPNSFFSHCAYSSFSLSFSLHQIYSHTLSLSIFKYLFLSLSFIYLLYVFFFLCTLILLQIRHHHSLSLSPYSDSFFYYYFFLSFSVFSFSHRHSIPSRNAAGGAASAVVVDLAEARRTIWHALMPPWLQRERSPSLLPISRWCPTSFEYSCALSAI